MLRCAFAAFAASLLLVCGNAAAQVQRAFPANSLRGDIEFVDAPDIKLNGEAARLSPGVRIRDMNNLLVVTNAVAGQSFTVNYTLDTLGLVSAVWLLRKDEIANKWPRTVDEAAKYDFDPAAQTWTPKQ